MARTCYFCGLRCGFFGKRGYCPSNGYDLCGQCAKEWRDHGRADFLLKDGPPTPIFRIDSCTLDAGDIKCNGALIFFQNALCFLAESTQRKTDPGLIGVGGLLGGALGAVAAGAIQNAVAKHLGETRDTTLPWREALRNPTGCVVMKRHDLRAITYDRWKGGLTIETVCMKYSRIQMTKEQFEAHQQHIRGYLQRSAM